MQIFGKYLYKGSIKIIAESEIQIIQNHNHELVITSLAMKNFKSN